ncbi:hypothetical protein M404DRAFT_917737 [Pisolithus tinctorius Marx 270]|uniref:Uncharacterized protein n=1 Tax=Pisolithus tinctorius Marx 270 TaxID=870435 RepID=A0A0C3JHX1_PISTI|nr:hypothetical protein M404DRAFT_917737 [Pisolithus tinctorius Marx 270]
MSALSRYEGKIECCCQDPRAKTLRTARTSSTASDRVQELLYYHVNQTKGRLKCRSILMCHR